MKLREALQQYSYWQLSRLIDVFDPDAGRMSANNMVHFLNEHLLDREVMRSLWQELGNIERKAISYAYHHDGHFNGDAFEARCGELPRVSDSFRRTLTPFWLFIHHGELPEDLMPLVEDLVLSAPEPHKLEGIEESPEQVDIRGQQHPLTRAETEIAGTHDLKVYLSLCEQGEISVTQAQKRITSASARTVLENLLDGDFVSVTESPTADETIRPFGLDQFTQQAGFVSVSGTKTKLTRAGREYLRNGDPETLLAGFEQWVFEGSFDELRRISALYGVGSRDTDLSDPSMRRDRIIEALSWSPAGVWIDVTDFYRSLRIWELNFPIETSYRTNLAVGSQNSYWRSDNDYRWIVRHLYINAVIWEYLGTIGAIDLLYVPPTVASLPLDGSYSASGRYYSLYDGLYYFRINKLGAFLLGQADEYESVRIEEEPLFTIDDDRTLTLLAPATLTPNERSRLEMVTEPLDDQTYTLDAYQILSRLEEGLDWEFVIDFVRERHRGPLPESVSEWLQQLHENSQAFSKDGRAVYIKATSAELVDVVVNDEKLGTFCTAVGTKTFVTPASRERTLRRRLKELGYLLS